VQTFIHTAYIGLVNIYDCACVTSKYEICDKGNVLFDCETSTVLECRCMMRSLFFYISVFRHSIVLYLVYDVIIKAVKNGENLQNRGSFLENFGKITVKSWRSKASVKVV